MIFFQTQLIKYGAAMSFAFKEELNELAISVVAVALLICGY